MFLNILASIRTNNFQDEHCVEKIQALWQEQEEAVKEAFAQGNRSMPSIMTMPVITKETTVSLSAV